MSIGDGIAILAIWFFAGGVSISPYTTNQASWVSILIAVIVTAIVVH